MPVELPYRFDTASRGTLDRKEVVAEPVTLYGMRLRTPDRRFPLSARTSDDAGRALARDLAAALGLPYKEESAPY